MAKSADVEKVVEIIFQGKDSSLTSSINKIEGGLGGLNTKIGDMAAPFADFSKYVLGAEAALLAFTAGGLVLATKKAIEFESAATDLKKVLGENESLDEAKKKALELSNAYGLSAASILQSFGDFRQAGFDLNDAMLITKTSMDLVIAGGVDAATASELLVRVLKGFEEPAQTASRVLDVLNEVSNNYATDVAKLGEGMARISPIAKQMGFSIEETAGILTPAIEVFQDGAGAADGLKTGLLKLLDDTPAVRDALKQMGVAQFDVNGQMRLGKDIFFDVARAVSTLDEREKLRLVGQLVGIDQSARMVAILNQYEKVMAVTATATGAAGSAQKEVNAAMQTGEAAYNRAKVGLDNLLTSFGLKFLDAAKGVLGGVAAIENAFQSATDAGAFEPLFDLVNSSLAGITKLLQDAAKALPDALKKLDFNGLVDSFETLGGSLGAAFAEIFGNIDLSTPDGLAKAMQRVVDIFEALNRTSAGVIEGLRPLLSILNDFIDWVLESEDSTQKLAGYIAGIGTAVSAASGALALLGPALAIFSGAQMIGGIANIVKMTSSLYAIADGMVYASNAAMGFSALGLAGIAAAAGVALGSLLRLIPGVDELAQKFFGLIDSVFNFTGTANIDFKDVDAKFEAAKKRYADNAVEIEARALLNKPAEEILSIGDAPVVVDVQAQLDQAKLDEAKRKLDEATKKRNAEIEAKLNEDKLAEERKKLEREFTLKTLELRTELDTTRIKAQAELLGKALDIRGNIEIANLENVRAGLESLASISGAAADSIGSLSGLLGDMNQYSTRYSQIFDLIRQQAEKQIEAANVAIELTKEQIEMLRAKRKSLEQGFALDINADGLEPEIEAFMFKILEKVQVRVNEEYGDFLLGVG